MPNKKAIVATVYIDTLEFEGLLLPDDSFAISLSQISSLFPISFPQKNASRQVKALLNKEFRFFKIAKEGNNVKLNILSIDDFHQLIIQLAVQKKDPEAIKILSCLARTDLEDVFRSAFGIKFERQEREAFRKLRPVSKNVRKYWTDAIRDYYQKLGRKAMPHHYMRVSDHLNKVVRGMTAVQVRDFFKVERNVLLRDLESGTTKLEDLELIKDIEKHAARLVIKKNVYPFDALCEAVSFHVD